MGTGGRDPEKLPEAEARGGGPVHRHAPERHFPTNAVDPP